MATEPTVSDFLFGILPRLRTSPEFPDWPPDVFALCLALLKQTGAYTQLLQEWPPHRDEPTALQKWVVKVGQLGRQWRNALRYTQTPVPLAFTGLSGEWQLLRNWYSSRLSTACQNRPLLEALMTLVAVADEASEGVGVVYRGGDDPFLEKKQFWPTIRAARCCR